MVISRKILACALTGILTGMYTGMSAAEIYKWVGEDGSINYGEKPPASDIETETIKQPPNVDTESARNELEERRNKLAENDRKREEKAEAFKRSDEEKAKRDKNCQIARDRLASYWNSRVRFVQEDGSRVIASEEERQAEIQKSKDMVKEFCD